MLRFLALAALACLSQGSVIQEFVAPAAREYVAPVATFHRAPQHDSAIIEHDRVGGSFSYRTAEAPAYVRTQPIVRSETVQTGVSYTHLAPEVTRTVLEQPAVVKKAYRTVVPPPVVTETVAPVAPVVTKTVAAVAPAVYPAVATAYRTIASPHYGGVYRSLAAPYYGGVYAPRLLDAYAPYAGARILL